MSKWKNGNVKYVVVDLKTFTHKDLIIKFIVLCVILKKLSADLQVENETLKKKIEEKLEDSEKARKEASDIVENKILESTLESYVCLKVEDYLKLKNILDIDKGE